MRIAILGDGAAEQAWFVALAARADLEVVRVADPDAPADVLILGGPVADRADILRRAPADGPVVVCPHPPGPDDSAYLQASGRVVPDLPLRLHPGVDRLRDALADGSLGEFRSVVHRVAAPGGDLLDAFARGVDVLRALLGDFETLTASGDPEGPDPRHDLTVRLRSRDGRLAELRATSGPEPAAHLTVTGANGSLSLAYDAAATTHARLMRRPGDDPGETFAWSPHVAMLEALGTPAAPTLDDGIRAMELTEAARRSLRRRRTVDVRPAPLSEEAAFKASMATNGCLLLLGSVVLFTLASTARGLGFESAASLVYVIPLALVAFLAIALTMKPAGAPGGASPGGIIRTPDVERNDVGR
jgi:myo-inositol 2-dehydrogenase/D-chiro-inositol 1-dehydrogenase